METAPEKIVWKRNNDGGLESFDCRFQIKKIGNQDRPYVLYDNGKHPGYRCGVFKRLQDAKQWAQEVLHNENTKDHGYFLISMAVGDSLHRHDSKNGLVYRFVRVTETYGKVKVSPADLEHTFNRAEKMIENGIDPKVWSWGLAGLVTESADEAGEVAKKILGDRFQGWVEE